MSELCVCVCAPHHGKKAGRKYDCMTAGEAGCKRVLAWYIVSMLVMVVLQYTT